LGPTRSRNRTSLRGKKHEPPGLEGQIVRKKKKETKANRQQT